MCVCGSGGGDPFSKDNTKTLLILNAYSIIVWFPREKSISASIMRILKKVLTAGLAQYCNQLEEKLPNLAYIKNILFLLLIYTGRGILRKEILFFFIPFTNSSYVV